MRTFGIALGRLGVSALLLAIPAVVAMPAPRGNGFATCFDAGFSGAALSCELTFAGAGDFGLSAGAAAGNPWSGLAPSSELRASASISPWRSGIGIKASVLAGIAQVPGLGLAAPYGGGSLGLDFPVGESGFAIRTEGLAKFGGIEHGVEVTNSAGTVRYVDSWTPAWLDLRIGLRWRPKE